MKKCAVGNFVKQNINSHENYEGIDNFICNSYKIKSLLHKLPVNRVAGKGNIFAEHIFMPIQVYAIIWVVFAICV